MTKIASVATHMISVPRPEPVWTAQEESGAWSVILTEVKTDDGLVGYGVIHGAPMPRICEWVARFAEIVRGMDALAHEAVWDRLFALTSPRPGAIEGLATDRCGRCRAASARRSMAAIAGIDIALWDLKGKAAGLPVWRLLGGENRPLAHLRDRRLLPPGRAEFGLCRGDGAVSRSRLSRGQAEDRRRQRRRGGRAGRRGARRDRRRPDLMLDMNAPYDLPDCIEFARRVERAPHLLARGAAALVPAAGRFRAARGGDADPAGAWRARADPLHGARFHRHRRDPLRAVRRDAGRRVYRGAARRRARRAARRHRRAAHRAGDPRSSRAGAAALRLRGRVRMAEPKPTRSPTGCSRTTPICATDICMIGDAPGFGLEPDWAFVEQYRV